MTMIGESPLAEELAVELENWEEWLQEVIEELKQLSVKFIEMAGNTSKEEERKFYLGISEGIEIAIEKLTELR